MFGIKLKREDKTYTRGEVVGVNWELIKNKATEADQALVIMHEHKVMLDTDDLINHFYEELRNPPLSLHYFGYNDRKDEYNGEEFNFLVNEIYQDFLDLKKFKYSITSNENKSLEGIREDIHHAVNVLKDFKIEAMREKEAIAFTLYSANNIKLGGYLYIPDDPKTINDKMLFNVPPSQLPLVMIMVSNLIEEVSLGYVK